MASPGAKLGAAAAATAGRSGTHGVNHACSGGGELVKHKQSEGGEVQKARGTVILQVPPSIDKGAKIGCKWFILNAPES